MENDKLVKIFGDMSEGEIMRLVRQMRTKSVNLPIYQHVWLEQHSNFDFQDYVRHSFDRLIEEFEQDQKPFEQFLKDRKSDSE